MNYRIKILNFLAGFCLLGGIISGILFRDIFSAGIIIGCPYFLMMGKQTRNNKRYSVKEGVIVEVPSSVIHRFRFRHKKTVKIRTNTGEEFDYKIRKLSFLQDDQFQKGKKCRIFFDEEKNLLGVDVCKGS